MRRMRKLWAVLLAVCMVCNLYGMDVLAAGNEQSVANGNKNGYTVYMIFAERKRLDQPIEKTATRNMFYDEQGKHVRTKKEILDSDGNIRRGCKIIKKGEVYERKIFTVKDSRFKQEPFLDEAKVFYTDLINQMVIDDKDRLSIFDKNGPYLATKKVGKNNPKAEEIKADNEIRMEWNNVVDRAIVSGISETEVVEIKKIEITEKIRESVEQNGSKPELFGDIVKAAAALLERLIAKVMQEVMGMQHKAGLPQQKTTAAAKKSIVEQIKAEQKSVPAETKRLETERPPQPKPSVLAGKYLRLKEIEGRLKDQNRTIFEREKKRLSSIVREYKFDSVQAFYKELKAAKREYLDYQADRAEYEKIYGEKAADSMSVRDRLRQKVQEVKEREAGRVHQTKQKDKGAR